MFKRAWELASDETAALLCAAEKAHGALDGVKLGSHRELTVAEALLWTEMCGPRFAAKVAVFVGATSSSDHSPFTRLIQKAKVLRLLKYMERPVTAFLSAPMFGAAHPLLYKLGSPEALEEQAAAEAAAHMEELKRTAAGFGPFSDDSEAAAAIACAEAAAGRPLARRVPGAAAARRAGAPRPGAVRGARPRAERARRRPRRPRRERRRTCSSCRSLSS